MPCYFFVWDGENEQHLAEHGVTPEEFEEVVSRPERIETSRTTGNPASIGATSTGKRLICIYEFVDAVTVYPVTAYEIETE